MTRFIASRICRAPDGASSPGGVQRILPHSDQAEMALLGSILINNRTFDRVNEFLKPEHFANRVHGMLFEAIGVLQERGQVADPITLFQFKGQDPDLVATGGIEYLLKLANSFVSTVNAVDYGRIVCDLYLRRKLIELGDDVITSAFADGAESDGQQQIEQAEKRLFDLAVRQGEGGFVALKRALDSAVKTAEAAYKRDGKLSGMTTGLHDLDKLLAGMQPSDLLILAGRPSMGKTALAMNIAVAAARTFQEDQPNRRHPVAVFSLEMSAEQLASRLLADESQIISDKIRKGQLNNDEFEQLVRASRELEQLSLFIDDTPALQISALRSRARRLKRQSGLSLIVVDYLQLLRGSQDSRNENRVQEVSDITRGLKAVAKDLNVPVLALSQLSRQVEAREDKRPMLSDLRESGSIEQDADVVMFIYREEYYLARREPDENSQEYHTWQTAMSEVHNLAEIIVAKQRHGPIGRVKVHFDSATTRFSNHIAANRLPDAH